MPAGAQFRVHLTLFLLVTTPSIFLEHLRVPHLAQVRQYRIALDAPVNPLNAYASGSRKRDGGLPTHLLAASEFPQIDRAQAASLCKNFPCDAEFLLQNRHSVQCFQAPHAYMIHLYHIKSKGYIEINQKLSKFN